MKYKRVILKISGEALQSKEDIIDYGVFQDIFNTVRELKEAGMQVAIVVGGGNIYRGFGKTHIEEEKGHYMGMLATSINAVAMTSFFNRNGLGANLQNSFMIENIAPKIKPSDAIRELEAGMVVIFGGGTGKPFVSTDTGSAWRADDIKADAILMAKNGVDGVYTADPKHDNNAKLIPKLTFKEIFEKKLKVIDSEAAQFLQEKNIDVIVFNMDKITNLHKILDDDDEKKTIITI